MRHRGRESFGIQSPRPDSASQWAKMLLRPLVVNVWTVSGFLRNSSGVQKSALQLTSVAVQGIPCEIGSESLA